MEISQGHFYHMYVAVEAMRFTYFLYLSFHAPEGERENYEETMIVHSSLLVQSKHPDRAVRSWSKTGSSRISWRCFSSKNDKNIIMGQSSQTRRSFCPMVATACNSHSMSLIGRCMFMKKRTLSLRSMHPPLLEMQ